MQRGKVSSMKRFFEGAAMTAVREQKSIEELKRDLGQIRSYLVELLAQLDDINLRWKPAIELDYALKIGVWETECAKVDLEARKLKRRYQLAQAKANRGQDIDWDAIDIQLDAELQEWAASVNACVESLQRSMDLRAGMSVLSAREAHELKMLHRKLVKRLHPDLNPSDPEAVRYFPLVQAAYEKGDLSFLRSIDVATSGMSASESEGDPTEESLYLDIELARAQVAFMEERVEQEKTAEPYVYKDLLANDAWVESKVAPLRTRIEELSEIKRAYEQRVNHLKGVSNDR